MLTNEKYKGDALIQKSFTVDFLTKKTKKNEGEIPQYYVTNNHEGIIHPDVWDRVQAEISHRKGRYIFRTHPFTKMIICSQCGGHYGRKTWHAGTHNEKKIWRCANKYEGKKTGCKTPHVVDADIEHAFVEALATRITGNAGARCALRILEETVFDTRPLEAEREKPSKRLARSPS